MNNWIARIFVLGILASSVSLYSQNVAINNNGAAPNTNAILDVDVTTNNKGILIPRLSTAQRTGIGGLGAGDEGLTVYDETTNSYWLWDGTQWVEFSMTGDAWQLTGNAGTVAGTNFLGTTDGVDFSIRRNNVEKVRVLNTTTSFMDEIQTRDGGANSGDVLVRIYDSGDDGRVDIYENNAYNIRLNGNGTSIFNEQGIASNDFRIESDAQANQFFVDAGNDRIGIRTGTPAYMFEMSNGGVNVGAAPMASYTNAGTDGVALSAYNSSTANVYNGFEGITAGTYTGVFGLGITTGAGGDGVFGQSNDWQSIGVVGSRFNSGGADLGYGGLFYNDLGYTGGLWNVSDRRLKKDIKPMKGALSLISQLSPVTYNYDIEKYPEMGLNERNEFGFIAQELKAIIPEIVKEKTLSTNGAAKIEPSKGKVEKDENFLTVDYTRLIPLAIKGIQEQQAIIEAQNSKIEQLEKLVKELQQSIDNK